VARAVYAVGMSFITVTRHWALRTHALDLFQTEPDKITLESGQVQELVDPQQGGLELLVVAVADDHRKSWTNLGLEGYDPHRVCSLVLCGNELIAHLFGARHRNTAVLPHRFSR